MNFPPFAIPLQPEDALSAPIDHAVIAAEQAPAWVATCKAVPDARACAHCGALLGAPCVTCSGKVTAPHKGRGCAA